MNNQIPNLRIGLGQDSHPLVAKVSTSDNQELVLGGAIIPSKHYLQAKSDGDVIIHSLCNALSSALGEGSLGTWADKMNSQGTNDSREYLQAILLKVKSSGYQILNLSIAIEAGQPKLEEHREIITTSLAKQLKISRQQIGLTFTSGEKLTAFGKGLAIQAFCVVLLVKYQ